jgi:hypothetical protein
MSAPGRLRPSEDVVAKEMGGSAVLIHLHTSRIFELNATAARIWSLLEQGAGRDEICTRLREEFSAAPADVESTVDHLLAELAREGLVRD